MGIDAVDKPLGIHEHIDAILFVKHFELPCRWRFVEANQPELGILLLAKERSRSAVSRRWHGRMKATGLKRQQLMALQAMMRATIINRPRSGHRANRCSLSRRRFTWGPLQRRQLQHSGVLTLAQLRDQSDLPIGKLKRVVMHGRLV